MAEIVGQALLLPIQNQGPVNLARRTNRLRRGYGAPGRPPPHVIASLFTGQSSGITPNEWIMKYYSLLVGIIVAAVTCSGLLAQEKAAL
jgi:hypothetical protein